LRRLGFVSESQLLWRIRSDEERTGPPLTRRCSVHGDVTASTKKWRPYNVLCRSRRHGVLSM
jgi:hypothetical protein